MSRSSPDYTKALEEQGYTILFAIGLREDGDDYRIKVAATPVIKRVSQEVWNEMLATIVGALDKLYETPLDDLERQG